MDPVSLAISALSLLRAIAQISQEVHGNKKAAISLSQRCQALSPALQALQSQQSQRPVPPVYVENLQRMLELLREIEEFLKRFVPPRNETRLEKVSRFARLVNDRRSDMKSFQDFTDSITVLLGDLGFGVLVNVNLNVNEMRTQDCQDVRDDLQSLIQDLASLRAASVGDQEQLQQFQTHCLTMLNDWDEVRDEISEMKTKIDQVLSHLHSGRNQQSVSAEEKEGMKVELTELRRVIEDQAANSVQFPQLISLVDALNDSLVAGIAAHKESLPQELKGMLDQFRDTIQASHHESSQQQNKVQQDILSSLNNLQLSQKEETIRNSRLSQDILSSLNNLQLSQKEETIRNSRLSQLELSASEVTVDQSSFLGRGAFGEVKIGHYAGRSVAIKIISSSGNGFKESEKKAMETEVLLMSSCIHPCVPQLYGYSKVTPRTWHLILELCPQGSLWFHLTNRDRHPSIPLGLNLSWMSEINSALRFLHQHRIIHRDVKAENVLLDGDLHCKLTDFGLSKQQLESTFGSMSSTHAGSILFMAPEVMAERKYSHRSDIYAFGVTCYQILSRSPPPTDRTVRAIRTFLSTQDPPLLVDLLTRCLNDKPHDRPSATEIFETFKDTFAQMSSAALQFKNQGNAHIQKGEYDEAIAAYTKAIELNPNDHVSLSNRSAAYLSKGEASNALTDAENCLQISPSWAKGYSRKGAALHALKQYAGAIDAYRAGLHIAPEDAGLESGLLEVQKAQCRLGDRRAYEELVSLSESGDSICVGYLMIVLSGVYEHPSIPSDRNRADAMGTGLWSQFQSQQKGISTSVNPHLAFHLGFISEFEMGAPKNLNEATKYYRLAADQGHAQAQCNLGLCYQNGRGIPKDESEAVRLYRLATDQGHAQAQYSLGLCYQNGRGIPKDESEAVRLYRLAADQSHAQAQYNLGWYYKNGRGVPKDQSEAVRFYRLAADQGHAGAQFNLGVCYKDGRGVPKDESEAVRFYRLAADQGHAMSQCNLGWCYEYGRGVPKDQSEAVRLYRLAADQGDAGAQSNLSRLSS